MSSFIETSRGFDRVEGDTTLRVEFLEPGIIRVRKWTGSEPPMPDLIRYRFFRDDWPETAVQVTGAIASSELLRVSVDAEGRLRIADADGGELLAETEPALPGPDPGFRLRFGLTPQSRLTGLGDQNRERIDHRGMSGDLWGRNVSSYIPIPLLISSDGYGVLLNTTRRVFYDLGATSNDWFGFEAEGESADWYFLYGPSPAETLDRYTQVTGRPMMPPRWAMGLWFISRMQANAREFIDDCLSFRREGIPCDAIGLEPGWMERNYDFSVDKQWNSERFPIPSYRRLSDTFFSAAQNLGFKPGLWLCNDYDLSYEEERRLDPAVRSAEEQVGSSFAAGHEVDENLQGKRYADTLTRRDEPWYHHLEKFVDEGAHWFKQDGANQVLEHPDRLWGNGMSDARMHNLYPLLYSRQMLQGFREHTGRRTFTFTPSGWAGLQALTGTWTGDTGGGEGPLVACLNLSLSGHGMNTCDMDVNTLGGIQFGMMLPWAQLDSWNYWRHPWLQGERTQAIFTDYARLRYRMLPYIYSLAREAHETGLPMMRAMPLLWPDAPDAYDCLRQYMFGPSLLVSAFTDEVWLPEGLWHNFWTGEAVDGGGWVAPEVPENRGAPMLVPAGAIIPMGPEIDYVGQRPDDELTVHVWSGAPGSFTLYEDDGTSYDFEDGAFRTTEITCEPTDAGLRVTISAPEGDFAGAVTERELSFVVHGLGSVSSVACNGDSLVASATGPRPRWRANDRGDAVISLGRRDLSEVELLLT